MVTSPPWAGRRAARVPAVSHSRCQPCTLGHSQRAEPVLPGVPAQGIPARGIPARALPAQGLSRVFQPGTGTAVLQDGHFALSPLHGSTAAWLASAGTLATSHGAEAGALLVGVSPVQGDRALSLAAPYKNVISVCSKLNSCFADSEPVGMLKMH